MPTVLPPPIKKATMKAVQLLRTARISIVLAISFSALAVHAEQLVVAGSTTVQKRIIEPGSENLKRATGVDIKVQGIGTGKGMLALFDRKVPASLISESLPEAISSAMKAARDSGGSMNDMKIPADLHFHELAKDRIVVIVNQANRIQSLTREQLRDINTGKIRNWREVGGADMPITVVTSHAGSATRAVFQKQVMQNADYAPGAIMVSSTADELYEVSRAKGAVGAVSEGFFRMLTGKTRTVDAPVVMRPLAMVTVGAPGPAVKKVIDYFHTPEGRATMQ
jgi:phosphate transport system substrate-binding protein